MTAASGRAAARAAVWTCNSRVGRASVMLSCLMMFRLLLALEAAEVPGCNPDFVDGQSAVPRDCVWSEQKVPAKHVVIKSPRSLGALPIVILSPLDSVEPAPVGDYVLTLKRVVLRPKALAPAAGGSRPRLLPHGLFSAAPRNLSLYDVRMILDTKTFSDYLKFFRQQLRTARDAAGTGPSMHTDNTSMLNVPYWADSTTEVFSLTLVSGPCNIPYADTLAYQATPQQAPAIPGCNMRAVDNQTLVQTLLRDATNASSMPLLIRVVSNSTLGVGITHSIPIRRPIVLLGMVSAPTSIDMGMVVNQLNVTLPYGKVTWQSVILENLAPGDAVSAVTAAPFSTTVSSNVWAMYCNRSASSCLNLNNVTLVIPTQEELNYQVFMYTMYNSQAPALRDLTDFYRSDLQTSIIQFVPGPGNDTLTVIRLLSKGWDFWYVVSTLRPIVAPVQPMPRQALVMQRYRAGALVYALQDCGGFVAALASKSTSTRTRVWTLINNVSIADDGNMHCSWPDGNVTYPTQLLGPVVHTHGPSARVHDSGTAASPLSPEAIVLGHADANTNRNGTPAVDPYLAYDVARLQDVDPSGPPYDELYSLNFGYVPSLFQLPVDAHDKFLVIQNLTLLQLPQMAPTRSLRGLLRRRLLQPSEASPIGIWTMLLWPIRRTMFGVPVTISDSQLFIPQPEWDALANEARDGPSFALQLQGQAGGLTFTGVTLLDNHTLRVGAFQGPGVSGSNLWLMPDPEAAAMPGYSWPSELFSAGSSGSSTAGGSSSSGQSSTAVRVGIGVAAGVLGLLAIGLIALLMRLRKRHAERGHGDMGYGDKVFVNGDGSGVVNPSKQFHGDGDSRKSAGEVLFAGGEGNADISKLHDTVGTLPNGQAQPLGAAAGSAAAAIAAGTLASRTSSLRQPSDGGASRRSSESTGTPAARPADDACVALGASLAGVVNADSKAQEGTGGDRSRTSMDRSPSSVEQTIANGLERWNAAVSQTTLQIMQRRLQSNTALYGHAASVIGSSGVSYKAGSQQQQRLKTQDSPSRSQVASPASSATAPPGGGTSGSETEQGLQLHSIIGTGSFGSVYLGSWRGKRVAIKVMHLQSNALLDADHSGCHSQDYSEEQQQERLQRHRAQNSPPHMAIMEAVVSSTMSHPNVVQVYTYMLSPLMVQPGVQGGQAPAACEQQPNQQQDQPGADGHNGGVFGWQLRLVMEYADQGTLREALDKRRLPRLSGTTFPHPSVVFSLIHDITAAMLHLHSEGIVHGDLKAGNVLLTANATPGSSTSCTGQFARSVGAWTAAGSQPLSAKVADFGMAMPLGPKDTHATMLARGTPTHMSPELFMAGHVSKASDVYAYGILLYEIITGRRAYTGVPIPLLPHEVAMQGLRPEWPNNMPAEVCRLRDLAEACWQHKPQDRPVFDKIMQILEGVCTLPQQQQRQQQPQPQHQPQQAQTPFSDAQQAGGAEEGSSGVTRANDVISPMVVEPVVVERKASKEQMSWSEISYGGSKHDGGWS